MIIDSPSKALFPSLRELWKDAFGDTDEFLDVFWRTAFSRERCRCVTLDGRLASALYWFDCEYQGERIAYLYAIATATEFRGRGICHELMKNTLAHLAQKGYAGAILVPARKDLFGFYESMGYKVCVAVGSLSCSASDKSTDVRQIGVSEYAELRRHFLPNASVIQENENLRFLEATASLYAGDGFLLAARNEDGILYGVELLGDSTAAPKILASLGYAKGEFRIPSGDKPFAVYQSLGEGVLPPPSYFGLCLA